MKKRARTKKPTKSKAAKATPRPSTKTATAKVYTPSPIQGIGWAPFRYPLS